MQDLLLLAFTAAALAAGWPLMGRLDLFFARCARAQALRALSAEDKAECRKDGSPTQKQP